MISHQQHPHASLRLTVGAPIYTRDEARIGTVKEIRGGAFKVDAPWERDYWLPTEVLGTAVAGEIVGLTIDRADIDRYKINEPAVA